MLQGRTKYSIKIARQLAVFLACMLAFPAFNQIDTKHYIPPMFGRDNLGDHYLVLSTTEPTPFPVTVTTGDGTVIHTTTISNNTTITIPLGSEINSPFLVKEIQLNTPLSQKGLIVYGDHPFSATIRVIADEQAASLLSKGAQAAKGKDFRVLHSFNNSSFSDDKTNTFSIMATEDNTLVNVSGIHSGVVLKNMPASGSPLTTDNFTISLQAGESVVYAAYLNEPTATNNTNGTVGTKIHSNKDIVVNSGSWLGGNALVGITSSGAYANGRDIGIDQMLPLERIGSEYVLVKGNGMDNERIVVVAEQNNTQLFLNGNTAALATINAGQSYVIPVNLYSANANLYLRGSKPIYVGQSINVGDGISDDFERQYDFNCLSPIECSGAHQLKLPNVDFIGTPQFKVIVDAGNDLFCNGTLMTGAMAVPGNPDYETYSISGNYQGDVILSSNGLIRAHLLNLNGHQGAGSYFAGFARDIKMSAVFHNDIGTNEHVLPEGCGSVDIIIQRGADLINEIDTIFFNYSGTAATIWDYAGAVPFVILNPGDTTTQFTLNMNTDSPVETIETAVIHMTIPGTPCGKEFIDFKIQDVQAMSASLIYDPPVCPGENVTVSAGINGGLAPYAYNWSTGSVASSIDINPSNPHFYQLTVTDFCGTVAQSDSVAIGVASYSLSIASSPDITIECPYTDVNLFTEALGGTGNFTYDWQNAGSVVGSGASTTVNPSVTGNYLVTATDGCGISVTDTVGVFVNVSMMTIQPLENKTICPYTETELHAMVSGGKPPYTYNWNIGQSSQDITVFPAYTKMYEVTVSDECHSYTISEKVIINVQQPEASFDILSSLLMENVRVNFDNRSIGATNYFWDLGNGSTATTHSPSTIYKQTDWYTISLVAVDDLGCTDTITKPLFIEPEFYFFAPNSFTPDGNSTNSTYSVSAIGASSLQFDLYNRWGELIFTTNDPYFAWDGTHQGEEVPVGVYVYKCTVTDELGRKKEFPGHVNLLR